jgi:excisionase family DNA binding protein
VSLDNLKGKEMDLAHYQIQFSASQQSVVNQKTSPDAAHKFATHALNPTPKKGKDDVEIFGNLITKGELAQLFDVSISFIEKLMAKEGLPHFKIGRSVRFRCEEVREWLLRRRFP